MAPPCVPSISSPSVYKFQATNSMVMMGPLSHLPKTYAPLSILKMNSFKFTSLSTKITHCGNSFQGKLFIYSRPFFVLYICLLSFLVVSEWVELLIIYEKFRKFNSMLLSLYFLVGGQLQIYSSGLPPMLQELFTLLFHLLVVSICFKDYQSTILSI